MTSIKLDQSELGQGSDGNATVVAVASQEMAEQRGEAIEVESGVG